MWTYLVHVFCSLRQEAKLTNQVACLELSDLGTHGCYLSYKLMARYEGKLTKAQDVLDKVNVLLNRDAALVICTPARRVA